MKIAIVTVGTRGDVQPYAAVARALASRGHEVRIATHDEHRSLVEAYGIEHRSMRGSFRELLASDTGRAWLASGNSPSKWTRYGKELFGDLQVAWCEDADAAVEGADAVCFYILGVAGLHAAQRRKIPAIALCPWPTAPTAEIAPAAAVWLEAFPKFLRRPIGHLIARFAFGTFNEAHQQYRVSVGLPRYAAKDTYHFVLDSAVPIVHLFSETVVPRPTDWAPHHRVAGFAFVPPSEYTPPARLTDFLSSGPPPIYIGFGSMTGFAPEALAELTTKAARIAGVRAIVASGWAGLAPLGGDDILVIDEVPHDWLFPRVAAVVHHGGAGTFAEGLRAGRPTAIAAFFGDQPWWGRINEKLGTGPRALRRESVTAESLAAAIGATPNFRARAEEIGIALRAEDGAGSAAEMIIEYASRRS